MKSKLEPITDMLRVLSSEEKDMLAGMIKKSER